MSALNINSISTSSNTTPNQIDLKALQDSSLNGEGGFLAEAGSYYNAFFNVHFDKVYHFSHVEIGRLKMDGEFTFFPTVAFQVSSNVFESTSNHWTEFKTVYLDDEPTAITKIPLNFSAKNLQFMSVEGDTTVVEVGFIRFFGKEDCASDDTPKDAQFYADKVSKEFKTISKGVQLTIPDFSGISLENFTQEGESSIVMTIPDLDVGNNRQTFITALQQARSNEKFVTWLNLNDIVFTNPTQSPITVTKMDYEYLNLENQWVSFLESEAGRNLGGYKEVYEETLKKIVKVHTFEIQNWEWFKNFTIEPNSSRSLHVQGFVQCEGKVHKLDFDPTSEGLPPRRRVPIELFPQPLTVRLTLHDSFGKIAKLKIQQLNKYPKVKSEEEYRMIHKLKDHEFLISCDDDFNKERVFVSVKSVVKMLYVQIHSRYNTKHAQFTIDELRQLETKKVESKTVLDTPMHKVKVDLMFDKENNYKTYAVKVSVETETNFIEKVVPVFGIIESLIQK